MKLDRKSVEDKGDAVNVEVIRWHGNYDVPRGRIRDKLKFRKGLLRDSE